MTKAAARRKDHILLLVAAVGCSGLHISLYAAGQRTTGALGPAAELVMNLVVAACLPLVVWFPRTVAAVGLAATIAAAIGGSLAPGLLLAEDQLTPARAPTATPLIIWCFVHRLPRRQAVPLAVAFAVTAVRPWDPSWTSLYAGLTATALPAVLALYFRARADLLRSLRERAELAERERLLLTERARAAERQRLAAAMHDLVTGHVTEMVLHAGALKVAAPDEDLRTAAQQIRDAGSRALGELRDLIGLVRDDDESPVQTQRSVQIHRGDSGGGQEPSGDLSALARTAGAELVITGDPGVTSPAIARAAFRVVQESLTNVRKHAPGSDITVRVQYGSYGMQIDVENTAGRTPPDPVLSGSGSGTGLAGLARRVSLLGGTFAAEPDGDGFRVTACLPTTIPT